MKADKDRTEEQVVCFSGFRFRGRPPSFVVLDYCHFSEARTPLAHEQVAPFVPSPTSSLALSLPSAALSLPALFCTPKPLDSSIPSAYDSIIQRESTSLASHRFTSRDLAGRHTSLLRARVHCSEG